MITNNRWFKIFKNKFIFTSIIFAIWVGIFDRDNLMTRSSQIEENELLLNTKAYYLEKIKKDSIRLNDLKTNAKNLEKFAREEYLMKKDNEDIFIIVYGNNKGIDD